MKIVENDFGNFILLDDEGKQIASSTHPGPLEEHVQRIGRVDGIIHKLLNILYKYDVV